MPNNSLHIAQLAMENEIGVPTGGRVSTTLVAIADAAAAVTAKTCPPTPPGPAAIANS